MLAQMNLGLNGKMKMNKTIMEGGHFQEKGYWYKLYLTLPTIVCTETVNMYNRKHKVKKFSADSSFWLTSNNIYCNIGMKVLGFGLGLEIHSRS